MAALPRITVITPSYNQASFLEYTIQSVLKQDYSNLQYGIVDGCSTDGSIQIINRYRRQLDFAIVEKDEGQTDAINKGLHKADGEIVCFLNSDDTFTPNSLRAVGEYFHDHPDHDWIMGNCMATDAGGNFLEQLKATPVDDLAHALIRHKPFVMPQPSIFWRKKLTDELGKFDRELEYTMDFEMWCRFLANGVQLHVLDRNLSTYRLHDDSKTVALRDRQTRDHIEVERRYATYLPLKQRVQLYRILGYRLRQQAITSQNQKLWGQVLRRPWWLLSEDIRGSLFASDIEDQKAAA